MITKEEYIKAIDESIAHWNKDIVKVLEKGRMIDLGISSSDHCALCKLSGEYAKINSLSGFCVACPLAWLNKRCELNGSPWKVYRDVFFSDFEDKITAAKSVIIALEEAKKYVDEVWDGESIEKPNHGGR